MALTVRPTDRFEVRELHPVAAREPGTLCGYGCVFNQLNYGDVIAPGAFSDTLKAWKARGKLPPMLSQHGGIGMMADDMTPVGQWDVMREDEHGLYAEGHLFAMDTDRAKLLYEALTSGVLDGLSIGFVPVTVRYGQAEEEPDRTILAVDLWELSLVTFPRQSNARVMEANSIAEFTVRDVERALRQCMSRNQARLYAGVIHSAAKLEAQTGGMPDPAPNRRDAGEDSGRELEQKLVEMIGAMGAAIVQG